ncbi:MAG TPA: 23S rRNA (adenine(2503)-C(2))-methyltransferase RlmN [Acidimicrobiia bacterium]|nr:23S rRNA (adenine(2503)-C(2))-methyltransferase RlmN [Acidimicrobiia bacterium]
MTARYDAEPGMLAQLLASWGEPRFRARQVWDALYRQRRPLEDATDVPSALRERLAAVFPVSLQPVSDQRDRADGTRKWLWTGTDGAQLETVLMSYAKRATVCVSSQAGCAMGCTFCATGQAGFERHLTAGEIIEQVLRAGRASEQRISNVVYMGMGEPLANFDEVWRSVERLHGDLGISARHLTISTVGVVPGIRRLAETDLPVTLAVSLHAADDGLRDRLVPLNARYPLAEVLDAACDYSLTHGRRVTFEYACIADVNDGPDQAERLAGLLGDFPGAGGAHVNLIPLNPTASYTGHKAAPERVQHFADVLMRAGIQATVRKNRGTAIDAACGQLRSRSDAAGARDGVAPADPPTSDRMSP